MRDFLNAGSEAPPVFVYKRSPASRHFRRAADIIGALLLGAIALPILLAACIAIFLDDGAPFIFRQRRVGRFGRLFTIYKLRTMKKTACTDAYKPSSGDAGITHAGAILRKLSIDELPQLFNVLRGDMSIVGPRPEMPFIVRRYQKWQHLRLLATPGLTCIWQTECRSTIPLDHPRATMMDLAYIERASPAVDAGLVLRTIGAVFSTRGAR
jgi:lipopolysaccharide/colanic/teichoic acid biosynthesis glycosyltransferase